MSEGKLRERHDGWTAARRGRFLAVLAHTGCVRDACRAVGLASTNAYRTRARLPDFAEAWDAALERANQGLVATAYLRAVQGVEEPIVRGDKVVATRRRYSDSLLALLIKRGDLSEARMALEASRSLSGEKLCKSQEEWQEALGIWMAAMAAKLDSPHRPDRPAAPDDPVITDEGREAAIASIMARLDRLRAYALAKQSSEDDPFPPDPPGDWGP